MLAISVGDVFRTSVFNSLVIMDMRDLRTGLTLQMVIAGNDKALKPSSTTDFVG